MHRVFNNYVGNTLDITGPNYSLTVFVDVDIVDKLKELRWCYEASKGQVYATDPTERGDYALILKLSSRRIYLWKYVGYLKTGHIVAWNRANLDDYRWPSKEKHMKVWEIIT